VIAVLDDEESVQNAVVRLLRSAGFVARGFATGDEFLKSWHFYRPDCLLLDLQMPGTPGIEVQKALNLAGAKFPVIIITANDAPHIREESIRRGAVDYLCKPLNVFALLQAVTDAVHS
jgi:FixJ family two-component response regulator